MLHEKGVLVVDDNEVNRIILNKILSFDYNVFEAENGKEALQILAENLDDIVAVVLDLVMPVMNGHEFMKKVKENNIYNNIPIIVTTGSSDSENEINALKEGAWDFVSKPYNAEILKFRLNNAIERSQLAAFKQLKYLAEFDTLTGIYNKTKFFEETEKMLRHYPDGEFVFVRFDIDRFQLVNAFFGTTEGDKLLKYISKSLIEFGNTQKVCRYGRIEADVFGICLMRDLENPVKLEMLEKSRKALAEYNTSYDIVPSFGIYYITDKSLPIDIMYDRAKMATKPCKGNYINYYAVYDEKMSEEIEREQRITNEMNIALEQNQFVIFLQPKYNLKTNTPAGAEALVRWMHPKNGLISPGQFIPVFERNGFISKLDYYVWEKTCILIRKWLDEGKNVYPISVNISRVNLYNPKLAELIFNLTQKYDIAPALLNLELTESAYVDNPTAMSETMSKLQSMGFVIMMDDFGSGYSSLNILKDIAVDILKIDMKFLSKTKVEGRGENIIASVVRMAKWLNIPVIAEGVEAKSQVDFLRSIGCEYIQGYYFAKPMPVEKYEELTEGCEPFIDTFEKSEAFETDNLWVSNPQMEMLFSNVLQAVAIYEYDDNNLEVLRVNNAYYDLLGNSDMEVKINNHLELINGRYRKELQKNIKQVVETKGTAECEILRNLSNGKGVWLHMKLKYVNQIGEKHILFGALTDVTAQKQLDSELKKYRDAIADNRKECRTIMIVDDVELNRVILREIFVGQYKVIEAVNGEDALIKLQKENNNVDIILLDLMMPVMDGHEFLNIKKSVPEIAGIPVIIITADDSKEQQINTLALGANDYIVKPFIQEIVVRRVNNVIESNRRFREVLKEYNNVLQQSQTDPLTNVYNRVTAEGIIESTLNSEKNKTHALLMMDIDDFKSINDTYGHAAGDNTLLEISKYLKSFFRQSDVVARLGGDEFIVFVADISSAEIIKDKCDNLCKAVADLEIGEEHISVSCSIGIAVSEGEESDFACLYRNADKALYMAKSMGKNQSRLYNKNDMQS